MSIYNLMAVSSVDGRYAKATGALGEYFSEFALIRARLKVEILWLKHLASQSAIAEIPAFSDQLVSFFDDILKHFTPDEAQKVKDIEAKTNHDVKAVEYYLKEQMQKNSATNVYREFVHFAATSEDINNLSYAILLQESLTNLVVPTLEQILQKLEQMASDYADIPMLARTHGQTASPTTLGKEMANFAFRLQRQIKHLQNSEILAKMNGAVGNYNAHLAAYPELDWQEISKSFIESLGLIQNKYTTQIEPHDYLAEIFHNIIRANNILQDFAKDIWAYISVGYYKQKQKAGEVGSSTMPHKVNPIDFENAEGNLGVANALFGHLASKLPISRLQRDLTDSTVLRTQGTSFAHSFLAWQSLLKGMQKLEVNRNKLQEDLSLAWEVLAEPIQTVMRRFGFENPYEALKDLTRGAEISEQTIKDFVQGLELPAEHKQRLLEMSPSSYTGIAEFLAHQISDVSNR